MVSVKDIIGVSSRDSQKLHDIGIATTEQILEQGSTATGRMHLADEANMNEDSIKQIVHQADIMRIDGIGPETAHLLCQIDVCTVPKLAYQHAAHLHERMSAENTQHEYMEQLPGMHELEAMIAQAKKLPKLVRH